MTNGSSSESYTFDAVGNRTASHRSASYSYQPFNRMTATATATMNFDANGNLIQKSEGSNYWRYGWDYENRMTFAATRRQTARYRYDALGRRVHRYFAGNKENTKFVYDGLDVVMDDDEHAGVTKYQNGLGIDDKLSLKTGGVTKYFLPDHLGSTVALTNSSGVATEQTSYDSFGNATTNLSTRYQYTGREYDSFSGFHYYRARWYDANLGRFVSEDPIGFGGGDVNLYGYVKNNVFSFRDPSGLQQNGLVFGPEGYFGKRSYRELSEDFDDMKSNCDCRNSFGEFGIDLDALSRQGIFIGSGETLSNSNFKNSDFGLTGDERQAARQHLGARAFTMTGSQDPRPHIFFNQAARSGAWPFSDPRANARQAFAHELVHAGGIPGEPPNWFWKNIFRHDDLSYKDGWVDKPYTRLLWNCRQR